MNLIGRYNMNGNDYFLEQWLNKKNIQVNP